MDAKRGNATGTRHGASKTSVASRHLNNANVARKYGSEVSLTPSQARHNADNPRKSPLDALSRLNNRQDPFQRRSGLQDVDDSFMATNAFARPSRVRNTGLDGGVQQGNQQVGNPAMAPLRVASGQEPQQQMQYQQQQQQPMQAAQPPVANMASSQQQQPAATQQQQQPQQQQQLPPVTVVPSQQSLQQQQQYVQPPAAGQPSRHDAYHGGRAHVQHQHQHYEQQQDAPAQGQVQAQQQQQQQQPPAQVSPRKQQQQQQQMHQQQQGHAGQQSALGGGASAAPPAAEMCTTCPNCQTTIYLVRTPEMGHGDGGMPMQ